MASKILLTIVAILVVGGCTTNHSIGSIQINQDTEALPSDYRDIAADTVRGRDAVSGAGLLVSEPNTMIGEGPFEPRRWYVCVRGIKPVGKSGQIPVQRHIENYLSDAGAVGHYDVVIMFQEIGHPTVLEGYDSRLCQNLSFSMLS